MALLHQRFNFSIRPSDKELEWFDHYDELFDQYIDSDSFQLSDDTTEQRSSLDLNFFDVSGSSNGSDHDHADTSPIPELDARQVESEDAWQATLRYLEQNAASSFQQGIQASVYPESSGRAAASDPELFSLQTISTPLKRSRVPISSTPVSPAPYRVRPKLATALTSAASGRKPTGVQKSPRKGSISPKMMTSSQYRSGYQDVWAKRIEAAADKLNLQITNYSKPISPPPSGQLPQGERQHGFAYANGQPTYPTRTMNSLDDEISPLSNSFHNRTQLGLSPLQSPMPETSIGQRLAFHQPATASSAYLPTQLSNEAVNALLTPPQTSQLSMSMWGQSAAEPLDLFASSPEFQSHKAEAWWSTTGMSQATGSAYEAMQPDISTLRLDSTTSANLATAGLLIQCDPASLDDLLETTEPAAYTTSHNYTTASFPPSSTTMTYPLPPASPRDTSLSPPPPTTPTRARRASSRPRHARSQSQHHRRKSSNNNTSSASSSGNGITSASSSRPVSVGFVNFTPDDSRKILTGVAPSGSSKTKARREKEAAEKRRKLSQAAARAVLQAGGDLGALEREGLLLCGE